VLSISAGLSVAQTMVMSLVVFTGASQFAAVGVIAAGGSPATAIGSALLLAARNGFYSMTMSRHIRGPLWRRAVAAHITIDESTALGTAQDDPADIEAAFWVGGLSVFFFWNIGTLIGALGGQAIGDPNALGLDAAFPAGFISLAAASLRHLAGRIAAVTGFAIAIIALPFTQPGVPILLAAGGAAIALALTGPDFLETPEPTPS
jgi:4-azaleucine resistance transporter AzlC